MTFDWADFFQFNTDTEFSAEREESGFQANGLVVKRSVNELILKFELEKQIVNALSLQLEIPQVTNALLSIALSDSGTNRVRGSFKIEADYLEDDELGNSISKTFNLEDNDITGRIIERKIGRIVVSRKLKLIPSDRVIEELNVPSILDILGVINITFKLENSINISDLKIFSLDFDLIRSMI